MAVTIKTIDDTRIYVNDKLVQKVNDEWLCKQELTTAETKAFESHIKP
jgi:hypothetical protein